ncbi:MAG TPA: histidine kinase [Ohtaekwangia sp.]|nr:histidine kinase [Ohtaekwangia sp.]
MYLKIAILFLAAAALFAPPGYAQVKEKKTETYKRYKSRSTSNETSSLLEEARQLKDTDPGAALNKVEDALAISIAEQDGFGEGKSYLLLGEINMGIREWKLALENLNRALEKLANGYTHSGEYYLTLKGLGTTHLTSGNYNDALSYFQKALGLNSKVSGIVDHNGLQLDISEVYYQMEQYDAALKAVDAIRLNGKVTNASFQSQVENQKAKIYARMNDLEKTKDHYDNSLNTLRSSKNVAPPSSEEGKSLQQAKEEIADVLLDQNRYDDEIALRNQAIVYNLESNNLSEVTKDKVAISKTLVAKGETVAALKELEDAAAMADTINDPKQKAQTYLALADLYDKNGMNRQALSAYKNYSVAVSETEKIRESDVAERSTLIRRQHEIEALTRDVSIGQREETIQQATVSRQLLVIYGLVAILIIISVTSYFIYKNALASKVANQLLALKSLRSQMNPHFIFNALNSVNHFIAQQDERTANKFLSEFSQLMRLVMEHSQEDFIPFQKEQEILSLYLKLEHYRFRDKFDYSIEVDASVNSESIEVPPMLIQPYIENAVWHGLRYKDVKGKLSLRFHQEDKDLVVELTDDGIGRKRSAELKTENQKKHNSTGLKNIQERLGILNRVYKSSYRVAVEDLSESAGTRVRIYLPITKRHNGL